MKAIPVPAFNDNYIWLIQNTSTSNVAIVDPGDAAPVITYLENNNLHPVAILITHHHGDHIGGIKELIAKYNMPVYGPSSERIHDITIPLEDGDKVKLKDLDATFDVLGVPGHTLGHIAYYGHGKLFIGDTLFLSGCGRLFEGSAEQMHHSLEKIVALPDSTEIYCAHEYTLANLRFAITVEPDNEAILSKIKHCNLQREQNLPTVPGTLNSEKQTNPFLRAHVPEVISAAERYAGTQLNGQVEVFATIRSWKDNF